MVVNRRFLFARKPLMFQEMIVMFPGLMTELGVSTGSGLGSWLLLPSVVGGISVPFFFFG